MSCLPAHQGSKKQIHLDIAPFLVKGHKSGEEGISITVGCLLGIQQKPNVASQPSKGSGRPIQDQRHQSTAVVKLQTIQPVSVTNQSTKKPNSNLFHHSRDPLPIVDPDVDGVGSVVSRAFPTLNDDKVTLRCLDIQPPCCTPAARVPEGSSLGNVDAVQGLTQCSPNASSSCNQGLLPVGLRMSYLLGRRLMDGTVGPAGLFFITPAEAVGDAGGDTVFMQLLCQLLLISCQKLIQLLGTVKHNADKAAVQFVSAFTDMLQMLSSEKSAKATAYRPDSQNSTGQLHHLPNIQLRFSKQKSSPATAGHLYNRGSSETSLTDQATLNSSINHGALPTKDTTQHKKPSSMPGISFPQASASRMTPSP
ncbi:hypothetical protein Nepgr_017359 [Nepenthes gracilis]|uniref:Uncharacterized protein n=1 Tax=Nepenthes gracilis TaxID=150966 RepID=A0AAD3SQ95_NEPGR|nr:hypothetical protein Nepgr_017359 [Nepenthes gracilis]